MATTLPTRHIQSARSGWGPSRDAGLARQKAYEIVQRVSMRAWNERRPFQELLNEEPAVTERLAPAELKACFDPAWYLRNVDAVFRRAGLEGRQEEHS